MGGDAKSHWLFGTGPDFLLVHEGGRHRKGERAAVKIIPTSAGDRKHPMFELVAELAFPWRDDPQQGLPPTLQGTPPAPMPQMPLPGAVEELSSSSDVSRSGAFSSASRVVAKAELDEQTES